jgi:hypothetical protein
MVRQMQYDLLVSEKCRCGGRLIHDGRYYICEKCLRVHCPICNSQLIREGNCFLCRQCGWGDC